MKQSSHIIINKVRCIDISSEGKGVVKLNKDIYFVDGLFLNEVADIEVLYSRSGVNFAKVKKLYCISEDRIQSKCKVCTLCGGCQYQQLAYPKQLDIKTNRVYQALTRIGDLPKSIKVNKCIGMKDPYYYRNKIQMPFGKDKKGNIVFGFYKQNSHEIIPVKECVIESKYASSILWDIKELAKKYKISIYNEDNGLGILRYVLIRTSLHYKEIMVVLVVSKFNFPGQRNFIEELIKLHPEITTIVENENSRHTNVILSNKEKVLYGKGYIKDSILDLSFNISASSFYQVNPIQVEVLYSKAIELLSSNKDEVVLDAYSGVGTIGLLLARKAKHVLSVEISKDAHLDAISNAKINNINNITFYNDDASSFINNYEGNIDVLLMDPPRKGSDEAFLSNVINRKIRKIIYISCDPETLARDIKYLSSAYKVETIQPVDMFPMTCHVETVVSLILRDTK